MCTHTVVFTCVIDLFCVSFFWLRHLCPRAPDPTPSLGSLLSPHRAHSVRLVTSLIILAHLTRSAPAHVPLRTDLLRQLCRVVNVTMQSYSAMISLAVLVVAVELSHAGPVGSFLTPHHKCS